MEYQDPEDIKEARDLLRKFEQNKDHSERIRYFEDALDLLEPFVAGEQDIQTSQLAKNIKKTYTKKLIESLPSLNSLDIGDWFPYSTLLLLRLQSDVEALCVESEVLKANHDNFIHIWAKEAITLFRPHIAVNESIS